MILTKPFQAIDAAREKLALTRPQGASSYYNDLSSFIKGPKVPPSLGTLDGPNQHPWTPSRGHECQFKCCHFCRPNMVERSYLDLDSIVKGDIPLTAAYGFGFHLSNPKGRPILNAEVVKNLGLRPNPPTVCSPLLTCCLKLISSSWKKAQCSQPETTLSPNSKPLKVSESSQPIVHCQLFPLRSRPKPTSSLPHHLPVDINNMEQLPPFNSSDPFLTTSPYPKTSPKPQCQSQQPIHSSIQASNLILTETTLPTAARDILCRRDWRMRL